MRGRTARRVSALFVIPVAMAITMPAAAAPRSTTSPLSPQLLAMVDGLAVVAPASAVPPGARRLGPLPDLTHLPLRVVLEPKDPSALSAFISAISSPSSPAYRHVLARGQFARVFGPSALELRTVEGAMRHAGLRIDGVSQSHLVLDVSGTAAVVAHAMHSSFARWQLPDGTTGYRLNGAARLPFGIARFVAGVVGVSSLVEERDFAIPLRRAPVRAVAPRRAAPRASGDGPSTDADACPEAIQQSSNTTYLPYDEGEAYGLTTAWGDDDDGAGRTIALVEFAPFRLSDVLFDEWCFGLASQDATSDPLLRTVLVDGGTSPGSAAAIDEPSLDIEQLRTLAPGAKVVVYEGPNNVAGPVDTLQRIATDDTATAVSISWGICEQFSDHAAETPIFEQLAAQGQTVFAAAGDSGSSDCLEQSPPGAPPLTAAAVDDPGSQPLVTDVGGLTVDSLAPLAETVWNECAEDGVVNCLGDAGGGGFSSLYPHPTWQVAPGVPTGSSRGAAGRDVPDLSVMADPDTGMLAYYDGGFVPIGGTSMAAPLMAALDADAAQYCGTATFGFLNPLLYAMARSGVGDFDQVTTGDNAVATATYRAQEYFAHSGYNMAAGLGSPDPGTFLPALCDGTASVAAAPATPSGSSTWTFGFHAGGVAYVAGTRVTLTAPAGTTMPSAPSAYSVTTTDATAQAPSAVARTTAAGSATDNVATLTLSAGAPVLSAVSVTVAGVVNPPIVGVSSITITDSADALAPTAPLALSTSSPSAVALRAAGSTAGVGGTGVTVTVTVRDAAGDLVAGTPLTATASGQGAARLTTPTSSADGTDTVVVRDGQVGTTTLTVTAGGVAVGHATLRFTDPWHAVAAKVPSGLGTVVGDPAVVAGSDGGFAGLAATRLGRLVVATGTPTTLHVAALSSRATVPLAASAPSLTVSGSTLVATYRSTAGHLVVATAPRSAPDGPWQVVDLTALGDAPSVTGAPSVVADGSDVTMASVDASRGVVAITAPSGSPAEATRTEVSTVAHLGDVAIGDVAMAVLDGQVQYLVRSDDGELVLLGRDAGQWLTDPMAADAGLLGAASIAGASPSAVSAQGQLTVFDADAAHQLVEYVGTIGNWSASLLDVGAEGTSAPAGTKTLPAVASAPAVVVTAAGTEAFCVTSSSRLLELSSDGVADPWAAFDLTSLMATGAVQGVAAVPSSSTTLLVDEQSRIEVLTTS